jgi:hypothetical protein
MVMVTVERNSEAPVFNAEEYPITVPDDVAVGQIIGAVTATDKDEVSEASVTLPFSDKSCFTMQGAAGMIVYSIVAKDSVPQDISKYFFVNPNTGDITVISRLTDDESLRTKYIVSTTFIA